GNRFLPGQEGGAAAVLRAGHHRDTPPACLPVGGWAHRRRTAGLRAAPWSLSVSAATELLGDLEGRYTHAVVAFVDDDGYPMPVATGFRTDTTREVVVLDPVAGDLVRLADDRAVSAGFSVIRRRTGAR